MSADESEHYISKWGVGKMPKNAANGDLGGRLAKTPLSSNGIDAQFSGSGGEGMPDLHEAGAHIGVAGGHNIARSNVDSEPALMRKGFREHGEAVALDNLAVVYDRLADGSDRSDRLLSFGVTQRQMTRAKIATDSQTSDFLSRFPEASRIRSDGGN